MEAKPPERFMYNVFYENIWHTINTYLRQPVAKPFTSKSKRLVINVQRTQDKVIDSAYPHLTDETLWRENTEFVLKEAVSKLIDQGPPLGYIGNKDKFNIVRTNHQELRKYELTPYNKTRDFRLKIAQLYVPVVSNHLEKANGRFPVFKIPKNAFDQFVLGTD